jgi:dTDP-glucose pyrophosphorylase
MKVVILAAGRGKRMANWTQNTTKAMLPIRVDDHKLYKSKPMLEITIEQFIQAGFKEFVIVVGYRKNDIKNYFGDGSRWGAIIKYVTQHDICAGTADAVRSSEFFFDGYFDTEQECKSFFLVYGDVVPTKKDIELLISKYNNHNLNNNLNNNLNHNLNNNLNNNLNQSKDTKVVDCGVMGVRRVNDPERYGVVELDNTLDDTYGDSRKDNIVRIVEKSPNPPTNLINAGIYILPQEIFKYIRNTSLSQRGEYELTDSIQLLINSGNSVVCQPVDGLKDIGTKEIYETNK